MDRIWPLVNYEYMSNQIKTNIQLQHKTPPPPPTELIFRQLTHERKPEKVCNPIEIQQKALHYTLPIILFTFVRNPAWIRNYSTF